MRQAAADHPVHSPPSTPCPYHPLLQPHACTAPATGAGRVDFCQPLSQSQARWKSPDLGSKKKVPPELAESRETRDNNEDTTQWCPCIAGSRGIDSSTFCPQMKTKGNAWIPTASYFSPRGNILLLLPLQSEAIYYTATHRDIGNSFLEKSCPSFTSWTIPSDEWASCPILYACYNTSRYMWVRLNIISPCNKQKYQRENECRAFNTGKDIYLKYICAACKDFILLTLILARNVFVSGRAFHSHIICRQKLLVAFSIPFTDTCLLLISAEMAQ